MVHVASSAADRCFETRITPSSYLPATIHAPSHKALLADSQSRDDLVEHLGIPLIVEHATPITVSEEAKSHERLLEEM
jgi:hypothetical protein